MWAISVAAQPPRAEQESSADAAAARMPALFKSGNGLAVSWCWPAAMPPHDPLAEGGITDVVEPGFLPLGVEISRSEVRGIRPMTVPHGFAVTGPSRHADA